MSSHFADVGPLYFPFLRPSTRTFLPCCLLHIQLRLGKTALAQLGNESTVSIYINLLRYPLDGTPLPPSLSANKTLF
jgi:hypothetical protein